MENDRTALDATQVGCLDWPPPGIEKPVRAANARNESSINRRYFALP